MKQTGKRGERYELCPLCAFEFEDQDTLCEHGCPFHTECRLVRCPNCGYEFSRVPSPPSWLGSIFGRRAEPDGEGCELRSLGDLRSGERGEVVVVSGHEGSRRNTLAQFGLVPGSEVTLIQHRPTCVIRIGETELALENDIAGAILVKPVESVAS